VGLHLRVKRGNPPEIGFIDTGGLRIVDVERCAIADETINDALRELRRRVLSGDLPIGGEETKVLWSGDQGENQDGLITRVVKGRNLEVHRQGFFQANLTLTDALVDAVLDLAALTGGERVLDCYCGVGLFSLFLAEKAGTSLLSTSTGKPSARRGKTSPPSAMGASGCLRGLSKTFSGRSCRREGPDGRRPARPPEEGLRQGSPGHDGGMAAVLGCLRLLRPGDTGTRH
jgi:tRNA/tmRNA/rRNA uracil-C5-methylase (TrmA/RlmC/RlmD family)